MPSVTRIIATWVWLGFCLLPFLKLAACSSSTEPEVVPDPAIEFSPVGLRQELRLSETMVFSASAKPAGNLSVKWYQRGDLVGQDPVFTYVPAVVGRDTLGVRAFAGAFQDTSWWVIDVLEDISFIPPPVPNIDAQAGLGGPGEVLLTWDGVTGAAYPLVEYLVAVSYDGPINAGNWSQATILGLYPPGQIAYSNTYTPDEHGMRPGAQAWFTVRVRDDRQQLSPVTYSPLHEITTPWYLGGSVTDDAGKFLPVVGLTITGASSNTDSRGVFLFHEPLRSIDRVRVSTSSISWFDFQTPPISMVQDTTLVNITLINHYEIAGCYGSFLEYLRHMTRNVTVQGQPDESRLFTWDEYPVSVFIPPFVNPQTGVDMEEACLAAMAFWDSTMSYDAGLLGIEETPYFVRTADQASSEIEFLFEFRFPNYGEVELLLPGGPEDHLGEVVPEKMQVWINTDPALDQFEEVQGVALHEFGHTLGMIEHVCSGQEYLMEYGGGSGAMSRAEPIHLDERRAARAIRNIPQGAVLDDFVSGR